MEWGTRRHFLRDPTAWWRVFVDRGYANFANRAANAAHDALGRLARRLESVRVITQNVDGLHAGSIPAVPAERLAEVHGRLGLLKCVADGCR